MRAPRFVVLALGLAGPALAQASFDDDPLAIAVVKRHAAHCGELHLAVAEKAAAMAEVVDAFLAAPGPETLAAARASWIDARRIYGELEALRFHGGPIDDFEPCLNAWPVDENYIDQVSGAIGPGIVQDAAQFPQLSAAVLLAANERGGETNISVGWHAVEFLLWGQDLDPHGPGQRCWRDFAAGAPVVTTRRRQYLQICTHLLRQQLAELAASWAPDGETFHRQFVARPGDAIRRMLTGTLILSGFELAGERLAVAYETKDQEQEHSCFSDTTCLDLVANQRGIVAVFDGGRGEGDVEATLLALLRRRDAALAEHLVRCLERTTAALAAIPAPFDRAFLGDDDAPGRRAIQAAIRALEQQAEAIAFAGRVLGFDLPLRPGQ